LRELGESSNLNFPTCLICLKLGEQFRLEGPGTMTLSYDEGEREKSGSVSSSGRSKAGDGGEGGNGTVRGSIMSVA